MAVAAMQSDDQIIRSSLGFCILPKETLTCRPGELNQGLSDNAGSTPEPQLPSDDMTQQQPLWWNGQMLHSHAPDGRSYHLIRVHGRMCEKRACQNSVSSLSDKEEQRKRYTDYTKHDQHNVYFCPTCFSVIWLVSYFLQPSKLLFQIEKVFTWILPSLKNFL